MHLITRTGFGYVTSAMKVVIYLIGFLIPRKDLCVFSEFNGESFRDNSKYAFLHASGRDEVIWASKEKELVDELQRKGYNARYSYSARGIFTLFQAKYLFCSHGIDVPWWTTGGAEIVQFWHGNALKKVGWESDRVRDFSRPTKLFRRHVAWNWRWLILTSDTPPAKFLQKTFRMADDEVIVSGYPRNDALFQRIRGEEIGLDTEVKDRLENIEDGETVFSYVPTYRRSNGRTDGIPLSEADIDYERLNSALEELSSYLLIKLHPHSDIRIDLERFDRILAAESGSDVYPLLRHTDCLITDYSSIYFDFLLVDRPIVFFPYDLDRYTRNRELCFDYDEVTPGPKPRTFEGLLEEIERISDGEDEYAGDRAQVRDMFHKYTDGRSARRVFQELNV